MSHTIVYHHEDVDLGKILKILKNLNKNPRVTGGEPQVSDYTKILWDDPGISSKRNINDLAYGAYISTTKNGTVYVDKGCGGIWNGQDLLEDYLSNEGIWPLYYV